MKPSTRRVVIEEKPNGSWSVGFTEADGKPLTRKTIRLIERTLKVAAGQHFRLKSRNARLASRVKNKETSNDS